MLPEVIGTEELLCLITLAEFVCLQDMVTPLVPVCWIRELVATVAAYVRRPVRAR